MSMHNREHDKSQNNHELDNHKRTYNFAIQLQSWKLHKVSLCVYDLSIQGHHHFNHKSP